MSLFYGIILNRAKAIVAFFLAGLGDLLIQSIEKGVSVTMSLRAAAGVVASMRSSAATSRCG